MRPIPPLIAVTYLGLAWGAHRVFPSGPLFERSRVSVVAGSTIILLGVALAVWAVRQFSKRDTTKDPYGTPTALVTSGPFQYTRNPMYAGVTLCLLGLGVILGEAVYVAVPVAFLATVSKWFVPREEAVLTQLFGPEFERYKGEVRRWI